MTQNIRHFRRSHILLIADLIFVEVFLIFIYLIFRVSLPLLNDLFFTNSNDLATTILGLIYFIGLSVFEIFLILMIVLRWATEEYEIREDTIVHKKGIITTKEETYSLRSLGNASITQSLFGKIFNYGTIKLYSPLLKQDYFIVNVHDPKHILVSLEDDLSTKESKGTIIRRS